VGTKDTSPLGFDSRVGLDGSGRVVVFCEPDQVSNPNYARVHYTDLVTGLEFQQTLQSCSGLALSDDANTIAFSSISWFDGVIDNTLRHYVYGVDRDVDRDGMADDWEQTYHLNPADPSDAALDPDGD